MQATPASISHGDMERENLEANRLAAQIENKRTHTCIHTLTLTHTCTHTLTHTHPHTHTHTHTEVRERERLCEQWKLKERLSVSLRMRMKV